jgi:hypothetical protein
MNNRFREILARHLSADQLDKVEPVAQELERLTEQLAAVLHRLGTSSRPDLLAQIDAEIIGALKEFEAKYTGSATDLTNDARGDNTTSGGNSTGPTETSTPPVQQKELPLDHLPPDIREWVLFNRQYFTPEMLEQARQEVNMEEVNAAYREFLQNGGPELRDLIRELEEELAAQDE